MSLVSVSQYSKLTGKDSGNIRRMLISGRLKGQKIGNQWVIDDGTPYPSDKRVKSGSYKNFRQHIRFNENKELSTTVRHMARELRKIYGESLISIVLYGSYARGEETDDSDVDIALILSGKPDKEKNNDMIKCVAKSELECGKVLSVIDIENEKYTAWKNVLPFYKNISKEGIVLWKKEI